MDTPTSPTDDPQARINALLARMDQEDRQQVGKSLDEQRVAWQKAWYLRYVVGPFLAGQLFDLWQWLLMRLDEYLWAWAEQSPMPAPPPPAAPADPKAALRQALDKKKGSASSNQTPPGDEQHRQ